MKTTNTKPDVYTISETDEATVRTAILLLQHEAHNNAQCRGFDNAPGVDYALMHTELSEGFEGYRQGDPPDDKIPEFTSQEAELADCLIRIFHYCDKHQLRLGKAVLAKLKFNRTRPFKHGKKF
jgi:NTP pyrophosphatase (non-canonical NTP hydrolase)